MKKEQPLLEEGKPPAPPAGEPIACPIRARQVVKSPIDPETLESVWPSDEHGEQRTAFSKFLANAEEQGGMPPHRQSPFFRLQQRLWDLDFDALVPINTGEDAIGDQAIQDAVNAGPLQSISRNLLVIGRGEPDGEEMLLLDMETLRAYSVNVNTSDVRDETDVSNEIARRLQ